MALGLLMAQLCLAQGHEELAVPDRSNAVKSVQIFPNPATDYLSLRFESPHAKKIRLVVYTIIGNTLDVETEVLDDYELRVKVRDLPSGYYLVAIHDSEANSKNTYKFLKR
jgi:hypothetical protein